jgi:hypothetical protein
MPTCPDCGAETLTVQVIEDDETIKVNVTSRRRIQLDKMMKTTTGERYKVVEWTDPPSVRRVAPQWQEPESVVHSEICRKVPSI